MMKDEREYKGSDQLMYEEGVTVSVVRRRDRVL